MNTVGIVGTFDVENYGDLLFPLIAQAALARRDPRLRIAAFSPNVRDQRSWPFTVGAAEELSGCVADFSAMLVGGGQIVRFDKAYPVPTPAGVELPVAYWLLPALLATTAGTPVIWNAVGVWTNSPAAPRYDEVFNRVLAASYLVGARDEASRSYFAQREPTAPVRFIPDTGFSLARYWPSTHASDEYTRWRSTRGVDGHYIVLQANPAIARYRAAIESVLRSIGDVTVIILPVCFCHGDRAESVPAFGPASVGTEWLRPTLIREIIAHAELVIASSLHACITALCYGVPVVRAPVGPLPDDLKYAMLDGFDGVAAIDDAPSVARVVQRGRRTEPRGEDYAERLERYWDQVADVAINGRPLQREHSMTLMLGWLAKSAGAFGVQNSPVR